MVLSAVAGISSGILNFPAGATSSSRVSFFLMSFGLMSVLLYTGLPAGVLSVVRALVILHGDQEPFPFQ